MRPEVVESVADVRRAVAQARAGGRVVGLVPTMGALHAGHIRLIERCRDEAGWVAVSVFVNPTQFGPNEDFARYPRTLDNDLARCRDAGVDLVWAPTPLTVYPGGSESTWVEVPGLSGILEGASRPGHFRGVATVVLKLFEVVRPDLAVFGQKDYQQQLVIRRMVDDLHVPVRIVTEPTVRESDGLALSSRNRYLSPDERASATVLHAALVRARDAVRSGETSANRVRQILRNTLESNESVRLDYAEVADADTLAALERLDPGTRVVALVAARVGSTRLIDNLLLTD
ncbi:MAG: pantoate--beta-alanine ligase [Isosphaeraceae bacterium]